MLTALQLDGVRGVRHKLLAFELFLKKHPEWVGSVEYQKAPSPQDQFLTVSI